MHTSTPHLRVARPVSNLARSSQMYRHGLDLSVLGRFIDHDGFDGDILGMPGGSYHIELTYCRTHPVSPCSTPEDLIVLYIPDRIDWENACTAMIAAGFERVTSFNPYWEKSGFTFKDPDGYRIVLQQTLWQSIEQA